MVIPLPSGVITAQKIRAITSTSFHFFNHCSCGIMENFASTIISIGKRNMVPTLTVNQKSEEVKESREKNGVTPIGAANEYRIENVLGMIKKNPKALPR